jgi:hypothetical protein
MPNPYENYGILDMLKDANLPHYAKNAKQAWEHAGMPEAYSRQLKQMYPDLDKRVDRGILDMALNYAGAYDYAARPGIDPEKAKQMARAYQYRDYGSRPEDTIQDYYENVEGINAFTGQRMSDEDLLRQAYEFARQKYEAQKR